MESIYTMRIQKVKDERELENNTKLIMVKKALLQITEIKKKDSRGQFQKRMTERFEHKENLVMSELRRISLSLRKQC